MRKNLFLFSLFALTLLITTGCYIQMSDGKNETMIGNRVFKGEYVEMMGDHEYTAYVTVYVNKNTIVEVDLDEDSTEITSRRYWDDRPTSYKSDLRDYLRSFKNKTVDQIKKYDPSTAKDDEKLAVIAGATLTENRILQAVKNALNNFKEE